MNTGLANVMRHEPPDFCRLNLSLQTILRRDNPLSVKKMAPLNPEIRLNVMRHIPDAFAAAH